MVLAVRVQLVELRGLPQDCPSISPTSWVNKISLTHLLSQLRPPDSASLAQGIQA